MALKATAAQVSAVNDDSSSKELIVKSKEIVIALVGYAGAGCTDVADKLFINLKKNGYTPERIKLSKIIERFPDSEECPSVTDDALNRGSERLARASHLQNCGDVVRKKYGADVLIRHAIQEFKDRRKGKVVGMEKIAFIIDSVKHTKEIELLSDLYGPSFRLLSVHCSKKEDYLGYLVMLIRRQNLLVRHWKKSNSLWLEMKKTRRTKNLDNK